MKYTLLFYIFFYSFLVCSAQDKRADELYAAITEIKYFKKGIIDDASLKKFLKENKVKIDFDIKNGNALNNKLLDLYEEIVSNYDTTKYFLRALMEKAELAYLIGNNEAAANAYKKLIEIHESNGIRTRINGTMCFRVGEYYHSIGEYRVALIYFEKALKYRLLHLTHPLCYTKVEFDVFEVIVYSYFALNENEKAMDFLLKPIFKERCKGYDRYFLVIQFELLKRYSRKELKEKWELAINKIYKKEVFQDDKSMQLYFIKFLDVEIEVPEKEKYNNSDSRIVDDIVSETQLKDTRFYEWIESL